MPMHATHTQVLINLLTNALKYTSEGYVRISVSPTPTGESTTSGHQLGLGSVVAAPAPAAASAARLGLRVQIVDSGVGIAAERVYTQGPHTLHTALCHKQNRHCFI